MFKCDLCNDEFSCREDFHEQLDHFEHWVECETCDRRFVTYASRAQHMGAKSHYAQFNCETCVEVFLSEKEAQTHMKALGHWERYCRSCDRHFKNDNNLRMHLNSRIHRGAKIQCPCCPAKFVAASGLSYHLETSSCPQAAYLNRLSIARNIQKLDTGGIIANLQIEWPNSKNARYGKTNHILNGGGSVWECDLCHQGYKSSSLNQHQNSTTHSQTAYHCINRHGCEREFTSLAALFNHLESESCQSMHVDNVQAAQKMLTASVMGKKQITAI